MGLVFVTLWRQFFGNGDLLLVVGDNANETMVFTRQSKVTLSFINTNTNFIAD
jgi:hypothetical protein